MNPDQDMRWWEAKDGDVFRHVIPYVKTLEQEQWELHQANLRHARLYANCDLVGLDWTLRQQTMTREKLGKVSENVVQSVIDTARSLIAKNRPRVTFQTDGADWSTQRRAKKLERFVEATFRRLNVYELGVQMFRDACVFGTGCLKVGEFDGELIVERALIDDILVDENEARMGDALQIHERRFISRSSLKKVYPEFAEEIDSAHAEDQHWTWYAKISPDRVAVVESWRLPSRPGAKDGRHTITIHGADLLDEPYKKDCFPFLFYRWNDLPTGFYGQGLAEQLVTIQLRVNKLNKFIDECQDRIAVPRVYVDVASKVLKGHITDNRIGVVIPYRGQKPIFETPMAVAPEVYQRLEALKRSAFELAGITQLSAQGKKPVGLESAVALREYNDIETQRFSIQAQRYEEAFLHLARMLVSQAKEIYKGGQDIEETWNSRDLTKTIKWSDVDLEEDQFRMSVEAASILSRTPAGRLQQVIELVQGGLIGPEEGRKLLGHPDLEAEGNLLNASIEDLDALIENIREGEYEPPEPFQNLAEGVKRLQLSYLADKRNGAPEEVLELYRNWIEQAQFMLAPPPAPEMPAMLPANEQMPMDPGLAGAPMDPNAVPMMDSPDAANYVQPVPGLASKNQFVA
jgi:hypothetical protein